jgi:Phospholipase_D-nuclease N-terminal
MEVFNYHGLFGLLVLILDIWAIVNVVVSSNGILSKIIWIIVILLLPVLGFILWLVLGPRRSYYGRWP